MTNTKSSGISFFGLLTIVFITLKLTKYIDWSWFWVLSPSLIPAMILIMMLIYSISSAVRKKNNAIKQYEKLQEKYSQPTWQNRYNELQGVQEKIKELKKNRFGS